MNKYLPSKKFLYTLCSILVAIAIVWTISNFTENKSGEVVEKTPAQEQFENNFRKAIDIDTDEDGLKDWEESLWKTDPQNRDTDGDGTSDGEEIKINRDPLKKAPGDEIDPQIIADNKKAEEEFAALSNTDRLAQTFFSQYIASKGINTLDQTSKQIILDTAISNTNMDPRKPAYTLSDLKISQDSSTTNLKDYGNRLVLGAQNHTGTVIQQELSVVATAISDDSDEYLKQLDPAITLYGTIINIYLNINVPKELAQTHLEILNNLSYIKDDVEKMKVLFSDPLTTIMALDDYKKTAETLATIYQDLGKYFASKGVIFSVNDPGYKLFNVVK